MRNQYIAKVLVHNKVVSQDVIKAHWGEITDSMDIGRVLVRAGILKESMYAKVLAFVQNLEEKNAKAAPVAASAAEPASATPAPAKPATPAPASPAVEKTAPAASVSSAPSAKPTAPQPVEEQQPLWRSLHVFCGHRKNRRSRNDEHGERPSACGI